MFLFSCSKSMEATASSTIDWIRSPIPVLSFSGISAFLRFLLLFIIPHLTVKRKKYLVFQTHVLFLFTKNLPAIYTLLIAVFTYVLRFLYKNTASKDCISVFRHPYLTMNKYKTVMMMPIPNMSKLKDTLATIILLASLKTLSFSANRST